MKIRNLFCSLVLYGLSLAAFQAHAGIKDGLVAYWPLNSSPDGLIAPDMTANSNHLSLINSPTFVAGRVGNAVQLDGASQCLIRIYTGGPDTGLPIYNADYYTICLWVRDNKYNSGTNQVGKAVFAETSTANANPSLLLRTDWNATASARTNLLSALLADDGGNTFFGNQSFGDLGKTTDNPGVPFDGTWHHIAWVNSNGTARVYIDGVLDSKVFKTLVAEPVNGDAGTLSLDTISLGVVAKAAGASSFFAGQLDDAALWARVLSQDEINQVRTNSAVVLAGPYTPAAPAITNQPAGNTYLLAGDTWSLKAYGLGTHPFSYQWYSNNVALADDGTISGSASQVLTLSSLPAGYAGNFTVVITNLYGSVTSSPAAILVNTVTPQPSNLTNGQVAYWLLDTIQGTTTPDAVGGYDMYVNNTGSGAVAIGAGKWTNAATFNGGSSCLLHIFGVGDPLPLTQYQEFTVGMWVNAAAQSPGGSGMRFLAMGNTASTTPWLSLANVDSTSQDLAGGSLNKMRAFFRNDNNRNYATAPIGVSTLPIYDGSWHHVTYVQKVAGGAKPVLQGLVYIDGVLDAMQGTPSPRIPTTAQIMTIGGSVRNTTSTFGTGGSRAAMIGACDDVVVWNRALTPTEIALLPTAPVPIAPPSLPPLAINNFKSDFAETVSGDSVSLSWTVSGSPLVLTVNNSDVLSRTTSGVGGMVVNNITTGTTNFTLIATRGAVSVTNTVTVTAVTGVGAGWHILDDFQTYPLGPLVSSANTYWSDLNNGSQIVDVGGKHMLNPTADVTAQGQVAVLPLSGYSINEGQARTLFARIYVNDDPAGTTMNNRLGVTDKNMKDARDTVLDTGPVARIYIPAGPELALGAYEGTNGPLNLFPVKLEYQQVYNLWIDITNAPVSSTNSGDLYSIWLQRLGASSRSLIVSNYPSDRDLLADFLGGGLPPVSPLSELIAGNASASGTVYMTDLYISASGYNSTVPVAWNGATPPVPSTPIFTATTDTSSSPGQVLLNFTWDAGGLWSAPAITGPWTVVPDSVGFSYVVTINPATPQQFFRIQR